MISTYFPFLSAKLYTYERFSVVKVIKNFYIERQKIRLVKMKNRGQNSSGNRLIE
ncbi:hypothetical protein NCCP2050_26830 [Planococcus sp. NCCP-2050]|nr:hypothetical protein NCCP2050_26830 [Planococcus sp. NCCP-2050]